jgi:large subunit ribosomal protein L30
VHALGLHRINQTVEQKDTAVIRGMVSKVNHLVNVEE